MEKIADYQNADNVSNIRCTLYFPINKVKNLLVFDMREDEGYEYKLIC